LSGPYDVQIDGLTAGDWNTVLEEFKDVSVYQTWAYGSVSWGKRTLVISCSGPEAGKS